MIYYVCLCVVCVHCVCVEGEVMWKDIDGNSSTESHLMAHLQLLDQMVCIPNQARTCREESGRHLR